MILPIPPAFKKEMEDAHYEYCLKHAWGDKTNAGKNYIRGKNNPNKRAANNR